MSYIIKLSLPFLLILLNILPGVPMAKATGLDTQYELSISFDLPKRLLIGTAKISIAKDKRLTLLLQNLDITGTLLRDQSGFENALTLSGDILILPAATTSRTLYLSYQRKVGDEPNNRISSDGIALTSNWYPTPREKMIFRVTAELPKHFDAIVESDTFPLARVNDHVEALYSVPTTDLHFIAGPYNISKLAVREGLYAYTMFFDEEEHLSPSYLEAAAEYIRKYEGEIGVFPFNHYVVVANRQPTGFGIPTFTLLGQMVLRLPFIISTSLGHEIVHSWFGNAVEVDYSEGNWSEGLTSYLSDYRFRREKGEGAASRKEAIVKYLNYTRDNSPISLSDFTSASHHQPMADSRRAVGYNRGALFFHELQSKIGSDSFQKGINAFYSKFKGRSATWSDLRMAFEENSGEVLEPFFDERLKRNVVPSLKIDNPSVQYIHQKPSLSFNITQQSDQPFTLDLPVHIKTMDGSVTVTETVEAKNSAVTIPLESRPIQITIDPEYDVLRTLSPEETPPVLSSFLGLEDKIIVLKSEEAIEIYQPFIDVFKTEHTRITTADELKNQDIAENTILFLDPNQRPVRSVLGTPTYPEDGVLLDVQKNPLNSDHVLVLLSSSSPDESHAVARRLKHYGKYSTLKFQNGRKISATIKSSVQGIQVTLEELPTGGSTKQAVNFAEIMDDVAQNRVVYVGETHTSLADHRLQLRIIESLHLQGHKIAIGMEMFPTSSQTSLDKYVLSKEINSESTFLKDSDYYNVWRYNYLFFRDIINFCRKHSIPVIALNLDRSIVSQVFRDGNTDGLDPATSRDLPPDRDLGIDGYADRLRAMHNVHVKGSHGTGAISGFIQSQGLWDETMAFNITKFLLDNPEHKMVVLAGSQHTRKDYGIPPRVARRMDVKQASVINIYNGSGPTNLSEVADYFFLAQQTELPDPPKIGIVLETIQRSGKNAQKIVQISPHGNAGKAGLMEGDILLTVGDLEISDMADLKIAMLDSHAGDHVKLQVLRIQESTELKLDIEVELTSPQKPPGHP